MRRCRQIRPQTPTGSKGRNDPSRKQKPASDRRAAFPDALVSDRFNWRVDEIILNAKHYEDKP
jgi:hypothetical protein